ncbi:MAG: hypothetical protein Ta2E_09970 [Mycoplasmoidaceae bacterium]|nr:MAG: hypothetical protein Ta2E_09970 [Mycoplasmoidaceae bacterium]
MSLVVFKRVWGNAACSEEVDFDDLSEQVKSWVDCGINQEEYKYKIWVANTNNGRPYKAIKYDYSNVWMHECKYNQAVEFREKRSISNKTDLSKADGITRNKSSCNKSDE